MNSYRISEFDLIGEIAKCSFGGGSVLCGKYRKDEQLYVLKYYDLETLDYECYQTLQHEVLLIRSLRHPNIVSLLGCVSDQPSKLYMVMHCYHYTSCRDLLDTGRWEYGLPEVACCIILREVLQALAYLHSQSIIHRDVRASHVLIAANGQVGLTGFLNALHIVGAQGDCSSSYSNDAATSNTTARCYPPFPHNSLYHMSPEMIMQTLSGYDCKTDIYSLGIMACELANGVMPFEEKIVEEMASEKMNDTIPCLLDCTNRALPEDGQEVTEDIRARATRQFTSEFHDIVYQCLTFAPTARPSADQLLAHPFIGKCVSQTSAGLPAMLEPVSVVLDEAKLCHSAESGAALAASVNHLRLEDRNSSHWLF